MEKSYLEYPKNEIILSDDLSNKPNIILIVIDSLRFDMLNPEVSPNIYEFSKNSINFTNHYSGGNSTRFGIFSVCYGIYGYFWHDFLDRRPPVLIDTFKKLGYQFNILSATSLTFKDFRGNLSEGLPYCSFILFDAPHFRRSPESFKKFNVKSEETNHIYLGKKGIEDKKNAHKNAIFYTDNLTGEILSFLKQIGDLNNSVVFITGDHGEEFYEN